jgi:hypothetical protein
MACAASAGLEDPTWFPGAVAALFGPRAVVKRREPIVFAVDRHDKMALYSPRHRDNAG